MTPSTDFSKFQQQRAFWVMDPNVTINSGIAPVYAQPLYVPALSAISGSPNVLFVATLEGTVYAYDADDFTTSGTTRSGTVTYHGKIYWARDDAYSTSNTALYHDCAAGQDPGKPVTMPVATLPFAGIVATPVIDIAAGILYVTSMCAAPTVGQSWYINALKLADGTDAQSPKAFAGSVPASGGAQGEVPCPGGECIIFVASAALQRPALLEVATSTYGNLIYVAFGAGIDESLSYHGWVFPLKASDFSTAFGPFATTPVGGFPAPTGSTPNCVSTVSGGPPVPPDPPNWCGHGTGIWMSGRGPAANGSNDVFVAQGNGGFLLDSNSNLLDAGESAIKFGGGTSLPLGSTTYFTPNAYAMLNLWDWDNGIPGVLLFSGLYGGSSTPLAMTADKQGNGYVMKQGNLGGYNSSSDQNTGSFQINGKICVTSGYQYCHEVHAMALFNNQTLFVWPWFEKPAQFTYSNGNFGTRTTNSTMDYSSTGYPGGMVSVSSNGVNNAIVWATVTTSAGNNPVAHNAAGFLVALKASDLSCLWSSNVGDVVPGCPNSQTDDFHVASFATPIVVNGRAYVPTYNKGTLVYGTN